LRFFLSASAAQSYSTRLRRTFKSNPIWTFANVSLLGSGPGESGACGHRLAPQIEVDVRAEQGAQDLPLSAQLFVQH
jgi:hypothetical protein